MIDDSYDNQSPLPRDGSPHLGARPAEDFAKSWLARVEANRANVRAAMKPEHLLTIMRNELAMFGRLY